jgi:hypothetical protein
MTFSIVSEAPEMKLTPTKPSVVPRAIDRQSAPNHLAEFGTAARLFVDVHSRWCPRRECCLRNPAVDGQRFGDRDRAVTAGIETVDLTAGGGLGNGPGKGLAGRGAAQGLASSPTPETPGAGAPAA